MHQLLSQERFTILKGLARVGNRSAGECGSETAARLYFVEGESIAAAAKAAKISGPSVSKVVLKINDALAEIQAFNGLPS